MTVIDVKHIWGHALCKTPAGWGEKMDCFENDCGIVANLHRNLKDYDEGQSLN